MNETKENNNFGKWYTVFIFFPVYLIEFVNWTQCAINSIVLSNSFFLIRQEWNIFNWKSS